MLAVHLNAGNDANGNPRRVLVVLDEQANVLDVVEEGYEGVSGALKNAGYEGIPVSPRLETTPAEYKALKSHAATQRLRKTPFRKAITDSYRVDSSGRIKSPGKFEGEMLYVPHFWDVFLNGGTDDTEGDDVMVFEVDHDERIAFPELGKKKRVKLRERDDGFVVEV